MLINIVRVNVSSTAQFSARGSREPRGTSFSREVLMCLFMAR